MIYTVTFNPALDYTVFLDKMESGKVNRAKKEALFFGGKGINVSVMLRTLGMDTTALGFAAGFTGRALEQGIKSQGVRTDLIFLPEGNTRINVKVKHGEETEINGQGPDITEEAVKELYHKLDMVKEGDTLVLSGSIPGSMPSDTYEKIMRRVSGKGIRTVIDAEGKLLLNVVKYHPFLIKPNHHELGEMFGTVCRTEEEIREYALKLQEMGAENVLVSMAGEGAFLLADTGESFRMGTPQGKTVNSVGAGDSMVAGFLTGYLRTGQYEEALRLGTAAGSATAFSEGLAEKEKIYSLLRTLSE